MVFTFVTQSKAQQRLFTSLSRGLSGLKKVGNDYINMDSVCFSLVAHMYPGDDYKGTKLKGGENLDLVTGFPPICTFFEKTATYKVKFYFLYKISKKTYTVQSEWYEFTSRFSSNL